MSELSAEERAKLAEDYALWDKDPAEVLRGFETARMRRLKDALAAAEREAYGDQAAAARPVGARPAPGGRATSTGGRQATGPIFRVRIRSHRRFFAVCWNIPEQSRTQCPYRCAAP